MPTGSFKNNLYISVRTGTVSELNEAQLILFYMALLQKPVLSKFRSIKAEPLSKPNLLRQRTNEKLNSRKK